MYNLGKEGITLCISCYDIHDYDEDWLNIWNKMDGLEKYVLGDQHYHTHEAWNQMQTVSPQDIATQADWSKPLNILYNNRIWMLRYNSKRNDYYYEKTKTKY